MVAAVVTVASVVEGAPVVELPCVVDAPSSPILSQEEANTVVKMIQMSANTHRNFFIKSSLFLSSIVK